MSISASLTTILLTALTMIFFAANSVLARLALRADEIDGGSFTAVRIVSGAVVLALLAASRRDRLSATIRDQGSWSAAAALSAYAVAFSYAYLSLDAGTGALILFALVQTTMIGSGMVRGERPRTPEWIGFTLALAGLAYLVSPGISAPTPAGALLMAASGVAWGYYSLAAKGTRSPIAATAGNFIRATPLAVAVLAGAWMSGQTHASWVGLQLAMVSGGITSGLGYAMWYTALKDLSSTRAAIVQLTVPVIAASAGIIFLQEQMTWRLALAGAAILIGVGLVFSGHHAANA